MAKARLIAYFSGAVQGVGFRYTTVWEAKGFVVCGYVKNLPDGRVEVVAEGARQELARFLARIKEVFGRHIRNAQASYEVATGEFDGFDIRY